MQIPLKMVASQLMTMHNSKDLSAAFCLAVIQSKLDYHVANIQMQQNF